MAKGRPRKPTKIKKLQGTAQPCRTNPAEPSAIPPTLTPPKGLTVAERAVWKRLAALLDQIGVLSETDRDSLFRYCRIRVRWEQCGRLVERDGLVIDGKKNPAVMLEIDLGAQLLRLESEFGMTPAARTKVSDRRKQTQDADETRIFGVA